MKSLHELISNCLSLAFGIKSPILFIFLIFGIILITLNQSCKDTEDNVMNHYGLKVLKDTDAEQPLQIPCGADLNRTCTEGGCFCINTPSCCVRNNIDSCNYDTGLDLALALACELNKALNGCYFQSYALGCTVSSVCLEFGYSNITLPSGLTDIRPNTNPFRYCSSGDPCDSLRCNSERYPIRHISMSIAYIDEIAEYIVESAPTLECPSGYSFSMGNIIVSACTVNNQDCSGGTPCWDTHLKVKYELVCCPAF